MFMRFLGIGIGHRGQHTTVEDPAVDIAEDFQTCINDEESDTNEESADFEDSDEEDEDIVDEGVIDFDDEDFGYGDL
jgi:hypothetical protein